jgi:uncharacterized membrane protein/thiol-disulfide isomerase/thioredoxin
MRRLVVTITLLSVLLLALPGPSPAGAQSSGDGVVHALFFYSPSCPHCHIVIEEVLPPLMEKYGEQLVIAGVDTSQQGGNVLYQGAVEHFKIPNERLGVPTLIVGDEVLVGGIEIPEQFPGLIEKYLKEGGVDWPAVPGLAEAMAQASAPPSPTPVTATTPPATEETATPTPTPTPIAVAAATTPGIPSEEPPPQSPELTFKSDPLGHTISIAVLTGIIIALGYSVALLGRQDRALLQPGRVQPARLKHWIIPLLAVIGLVAAFYLSYVETSNVKAVCGPVGDCNAVQSSSYALLFGFMPLAVLGLLGYLAVLALWGWAVLGSGQTAELAALGLVGATLFGAAFSAYLTYLEPFVIHAVCAWCLTSAVAMTGLMLASIQLLLRGGQPLPRRRRRKA